MARLHLALDQGTTSSRAFVYDDDGIVRARATRALTQHLPSPGLVEHEAEEIFAGQWDAAREAVAAAGGGDVASVGITNQRETVVLFERASGKPLHRAIVWQDRRTAELLAQLRAAGHQAAVRARTGLTLDPYFSAAKIAWLLDQVPGARARAERGELVAGTIDCWLLHRLTAGAVCATEPSNASRTSLFDLAAGDWSDELCTRFRVPRACLPEIRASAGDFGTVAATGWPIRGVLGDQQAALLGQGCTSPGMAKCTYGTGAFLLLHCGDRVPAPPAGIVATVAWRIGAKTEYALEGSILVSGALVQWLRDGLGLIRDSSEIEALARAVPDSGGLTIVPALTGLGAPHWDPTARGAMFGITRGTRREHIARAALEAMALQVDDVLQAFAAGGTAPLRELRVDGGATANRLLLEIQAALSGVPVLRPPDIETTARGAMCIARIGGGERGIPSAAASAFVRIASDPRLLDRDRLRQRFRTAVERSREWP